MVAASAAAHRAMRSVSSRYTIWILRLMLKVLACLVTPKLSSPSVMLSCNSKQAQQRPHNQWHTRTTATTAAAAHAAACCSLTTKAALAASRAPQTNPVAAPAARLCCCCCLAHLEGVAAEWRDGAKLPAVSRQEAQRLEGDLVHQAVGSLQDLACHLPGGHHGAWTSSAVVQKGCREWVRKPRVHTCEEKCVL